MGYQNSAERFWIGFRNIIARVSHTRFGSNAGDHPTGGVPIGLCQCHGGMTTVGQLLGYGPKFLRNLIVVFLVVMLTFFQKQFQIV